MNTFSSPLHADLPIHLDDTFSAQDKLVLIGLFARQQQNVQSQEVQHYRENLTLEHLDTRNAQKMDVHYRQNKQKSALRQHHAHTMQQLKQSLLATSCE